MSQSTTPRTPPRAVTIERPPKSKDRRRAWRVSKVKEWLGDCEEVDSNASGKDDSTSTNRVTGDAPVSRFLDFAVRALSPADLLDLSTPSEASSSRSKFRTTDQSFDHSSSHSANLTDLCHVGSLHSLTISNQELATDMNGGIPPPTSDRTSGRSRSNAMRESAKRAEEHPLRRPRLEPEPPFRDPFEITDDPPLPRLPDSIKGGAKFRERKAIKEAYEAILAELEEDEIDELSGLSSASLNSTPRLFPLPPIDEEPPSSARLLRRETRPIVAKANSNVRSTHALLPVKQIIPAETKSPNTGKKLREAVHAIPTATVAPADQTEPDGTARQEHQGLGDQAASIGTASETDPSKSTAASETSQRPLRSPRARVVTAFRIKRKAPRKAIPSFSEPAKAEKELERTTDIDPKPISNSSAKGASMEQGPMEAGPSTQLMMKRRTGEGPVKRLAIKARARSPAHSADIEPTEAVVAQEAAPGSFASSTDHPSGNPRSTSPSGSRQGTVEALPIGALNLVHDGPSSRSKTQPTPIVQAPRPGTRRSVSIGNCDWVAQAGSTPSLARTRSERSARRSPSNASPHGIQAKDERCKTQVCDLALSRPGPLPMGNRTYGPRSPRDIVGDRSKGPSFNDVPGLTRSISDTFSDRLAETPGASFADLSGMRSSNNFLPIDDRPGELYLFPPLPDVDDEDDDGVSAGNPASSVPDSTPASPTHSRLSSFATLASVVGSYFPFISPSSSAKSDKSQWAKDGVSPTQQNFRRSPTVLTSVDWQSSTAPAGDFPSEPLESKNDMRMSTIRRSPPQLRARARTDGRQADSTVSKRRNRPSMTIKIGSLDWPIDKRSPATTALTPDEATCNTIETGSGPTDPLAFTLTPSIISSPREGIHTSGLPSPLARHVSAASIDGLSNGVHRSRMLHNGCDEPQAAPTEMPISHCRLMSSDQHAPSPRHPVTLSEKRPMSSVDGPPTPDGV